MTRGLSLRNLSMAIAGRPLLAIEALEVAPGEIVTLMGPSGSGKSSLIAFLCGALDPAFEARGEVVLNGRPLAGLPLEQRRIGVLYQDDLLFAHLSVAENLAFAVPQRAPRAERRRWVEAALLEAELEGFGPRDPATLSGGQKARVALMRALLAEPEALLLDEPFSKLDAALRARVRDFTFATIRRRGLPAILVTHDHEDNAGRALLLSEGRLEPLPVTNIRAGLPLA